MASVGFKVTGMSLERFKERFDASFCKGRLQRYLKEAAEVAYQKAYELCPVDTGWMQGQIYIEVADEIASLHCDCEYASYNEYGWYGIPPVPEPPKVAHYKGGYRPFMRNGAIEGKKYFEREVRKWLKKRLQYGR